MRKKLCTSKVLMFLFTLMIINVLTYFNSHNAEAGETLPRIATVGIEHNPFVEGDSNKLIISSKNYSGKVQYQIFYNCEELMGKSWKKVNNADMINEWTRPADCAEPVTVDLENFKAGYYRFAVRVKRAGIKGKYENAAGDYDYAVPFSIAVIKNSTINLNGDMLINKTVFENTDRLVIKGVDKAETDTLYKLHLYDVKNNKWLAHLTDYNSKIDYDLSNIPAGTYFVNIWSKRSDSSNAYDGWKLKVINIKEEILPMIATVGIEHSPSVEGDINKLIISSKNYSGKVQYQIFYNCKELMGNSWEKVNNADMINEWTRPADSQKPVTVDLADFKAGYYKFAVRVKRAGTKGKYENAAGDYDHAVPFSLAVVKNSNINLNGDMLINKTDFKKNDQLVIDGVDKAEADTLYKLHLYDVKSNKWIANLTDYNEKVDFDLSNIPVGTYLLNTWVKRSNSNNPYDGWKLKVIKINSDIIKVANVDDLEAVTWKDSHYELPKTVLAVMEDGNANYKSVQWSSQPNTAKEGIYTFEGTVLGYDKKVKLSLKVRDDKGNTTGNVINMGLAASEDGWTYYCNPSDEGKLYKINDDNGNIVKVSDDFAFFINVIDNWIYYSNFTENGYGSIYKIRTDGTQRTKLNNDISEHVTVLNGWIYYANASDEFKLFKVRIDGTERTKLNNDSAINVNLVDDYIYYTNISDNNRVYRIKTDGTGKIKLNNDESAFMNVDDGYIYYANKSDYYKLYKMKTDGTGRVKISDNSAAFLNVYDGWIYYSNLNVGDRLYKIKTDGTANTAINHYITSLIQVIDDYVYYINSSDDDKLYRIKNDGTNHEEFGVKIYDIKNIEESVYLGGDYKLPSQVDGIIEDGSIKTFKVSWNELNADTNKPGIHTFEGTVKGYDKKVILKLTVIGIDHLLHDIIERTSVQEKGSNLIMVPFVKAVMEDGKEIYVSVTWNPSTISLDEVGTYTFEGTIKGYDGKQILKVTIIENENASK